MGLRPIYVKLLCALLVMLAAGAGNVMAQTTIAYTSFEEPSIGGKYTDTGSQSTDHALVNNASQAPLNFTSTGGELGFSSFYYSTGGVGLTDGDYCGVTDYTTGNIVHTGDQAFQLSDTDGRVRVTFDAVDLTNYNSVVVSLDQAIRSEGYEPDDYGKAWLIMNNGDSLNIFDHTDVDYDNTAYENTYTTFSVNVPDSYTSATLHWEVYNNSTNEALFIDNVKFEGTEAGGDPVVSLTSSSVTLNEDAGTTDVTVRITNASATEATTVQLVLDSGDAADINNYSTQTVTFPAGDSDNKTVTITITDDEDQESSENFVFTLQNVTGTGASISSDSTFTLTVNDNDTPVADLVITEIHYNTDHTDSQDPDAFLELYNNSSFTVDLEGFNFSDGVTLTFPAGASIAAGEYIVLCKDSSFFSGSYQKFIFTGALGNSGELVKLVDNNGVTMDSVSYDDGGSWPTEADGSGPSLELIDIDGDHNDGANWAATNVDGTPGVGYSDNSNAPASVNFASSSATVEENVGTVSLTINISNPNADTATVVQVALTSGDAADLDNYSTQTVTFPAGSDTAQTVTVTVTDDATQEGSELFTFTLGDISGPYGASIGNTNSFDLTINASDIPVADLVITEIMYNPASALGDDTAFEFLEIYNKEGSAVDLSDYTLSDAVTFTFPSGASIANGEYIIVAVDSTSYTGNGYQVFQWDASQGLNNSGETIILSNSASVTIDQVTYDDAGDWPTAADGNGPSAELMDVNSDNNVGTNWDARNDNGTPGSAYVGEITTGITTVTPAKVSNLGIDTVSIAGTGFGATEGTVTADTIALAVVTWNDTLVTVTTPATDATGAHNVVLTTSENIVDTLENGLTFFESLTEDLYFYAPFNGTIADESGSNIVMVNSGASFTTDRYGVPNSAIAFNGISHIDVQLQEELYDEDFTFTFWLKDQGGHYSVNYFVDEGNGSFFNQLYFSVLDRIVRFVPQNPVEGRYNLLQDNDFHLVSMAWDNSASAIKVYVDTTFVGQVVGIDPGTDPHKLRLGSKYDGRHGFIGAMDQFRIYKRALASGEISQLFVEQSLAYLELTDSSIPDFNWAGDTVAIEWSAVEIGSVNLEYSTNNGGSWNTIASDVQGFLKTYDWIIPNVTSYEVLVRITTTDNQLTDTKESVFTIIDSEAPYYSGYNTGGENYPVVVQAASLNGLALERGDEIGVFDTQDDTTMIVGGAVYTGTYPVLINTYLELNSGNISVPGAKVGNDVKFKIYKKNTGIEYYCSAIFGAGGHFGDAPLTVASQLTAGNLMSTNVTIEANRVQLFSLPVDVFNTDVDSVFSNGNIDYAYSEDGLYLPELGFDTLSFNYMKAYKVFTDTAVNATLEGNQIADGRSVNLSANSVELIGFPYVVSHTATELFGNTAAIEYADNGTGSYYLPAYNITNMTISPTQGIKVYSNANVTYTYPTFSAANKKGKTEEKEYEINTELFNFNKTGEVYAIVITDIVDDAMVIQDGTNIGIYDGETCVGVGVYNSAKTNQGFAAWMEISEFEVKGAVEGNSISFKLEDTGYEVNAEFEVGGTFGHGNFSVAKLTVENSLPVSYSLAQNYPNPFNPSTTIEFSLPESGMVNISLFNILGEKVSDIVNTELNAGFHKQKFDLSGFASGVYFYQIRVNNFVAIKKMVLMK